MMNAQTAVFDTDGTIVDTTKRFHVVFCSVLEDRGQDSLPWDEFFERYSEDTLDEIIEIPSGKDREEELRNFWLDFLKRYRSVSVPDDFLIEGVEEVFEKISQAGAKIGITTSCILPPSELEEEMEGYSVAKYADVYVTGESAIEDLTGNHHFSKVGIFNLAFEKLGDRPQDSVVIGDYKNDVEAGKELGAKTVAVLTGSMKRELLEELDPDAILDSIGDLFSVVEF